MVWEIVNNKGGSDLRGKDLTEANLNGANLAGADLSGAKLEWAILRGIKLDEFKIKDKEELDEDERLILKIIKQNSGKRIGELYKIYQQNQGEGVYKTFQRKIKKLEENKFISTSKVIGGNEGSTTLVSYQEKKLTDY